MEKYKFLALDIDGTVTNSNKEITPAVKAEIRRLQESGISSKRVITRLTTLIFFSSENLILFYKNNHFSAIKNHYIIY